MKDSYGLLALIVMILAGIGLFAMVVKLGSFLGSI